MENMENIISSSEGNQIELPDFPQPTRKEASAVLDILWGQIKESHVIAAWNQAFHIENFIHLNNSQPISSDGLDVIDPNLVNESEIDPSILISPDVDDSKDEEWCK